MGLSDVVSRTWDENHLFSALIELTYRCNLDCYFCYNDLNQRGRPLSFEQYRDLFQGLAELGALNLILSGGEPLAHPQFFQLGALAKDLGFVVRVKSNGHAMGPRLAQRLKAEVDPFMVETSLHGACAQTHEKQTRVKGSFDRLLENIRTMQELGLRIKINTTLTRWNENEIGAMFQLAASLGLGLNVDPEVTPRDDGDQSPLSIAPTSEGLANLIAVQRGRANTMADATATAKTQTRANGETKAPNQTPSAPAAMPIKMVGAPGKPSGKHCGAGSSSVAVDPFGNVYPCVQYRRAAGNLHDQSIEHIWRGQNPVLAEVRAESAEVKTLVKAEGIDAYCPGAAYHQTGNALEIPDGIRRRQAVFDEVRAQIEQVGPNQSTQILTAQDRLLPGNRSQVAGVQNLDDEAHLRSASENTTATRPMAKLPVESIE